MKRGGEIRRCGKRYASEAEARCSKRGLAEGACVVPCRVPGCHGWHVTAAAVAAVADTGPTRKVRGLVIARDGAACVCCGVSVLGRIYSLQHRDARGMGGTSDPHSSCCCNLVTMLGSATSPGCHERVESRRDPHDHGKGYWLENGQIPALTSVMVFDSPEGSGTRAFPTCDGQWSSAPGQVAA